MRVSWGRGRRRRAAPESRERQRPKRPSPKNGGKVGDEGKHGSGDEGKLGSGDEGKLRSGDEGMLGSGDEGMLGSEKTAKSKGKVGDEGKLGSGSWQQMASLTMRVSCGPTAGIALWQWMVPWYGCVVVGGISTTQENEMSNGKEEYEIHLLDIPKNTQSTNYIHFSLQPPFFFFLYFQAFRALPFLVEPVVILT